MATTYNDNGGSVNGVNLEFTYSFPYLKTEDIKVALNGTTQATTKYTISTSPSKITFNNTSVDSTVQETSGAPKTGVTVRVYRDTEVDTAKAVYAAGSSVRAVDLNDNQDQVLYALQEEQNQALIAATTTVQGLFTAAEKVKLSGIETAATVDQTDAEIRAAVEAASDSNVFTDADHTKLNAIETSATADQTDAEIRTLVESASDSNVFTDADHSKLDAIEASATADQTAAEIRTLVEAATDSNVFTDADHTKLNAIEASATADQTGAEIKSAYEGESDTNAFTDAEKSKVADAVLNADLDGKGEILIGDGSGDPTALAVGTNTHVLTADSTEATGVKWAAQTGSGGGGGSDITVVDESTTLSNAATKFTFTGAGVTATEPSTDEITVTIPIPEGTAILSTGESGGTKFLREDGDGTSSWQTVSTTDATKMPLAGGTFTGDVVFDNATHAGFDMTWDESDKALEFADDTKVVFGGDNGLSIYHSTADGSNHRTYLTNTKNDLVIETSGADADDVGIITKDSFWVRTQDPNGKITFWSNSTGNGEIYLYYSDAKKLETTATGISVTGNIVVSGTVDGIDIATDVAANTAKVTNATHTGEVTGSTSLTIANDAVTGAKLSVSLVEGDVLYGSGTDTLARLAKGSAGEVLKMNSGATAPEWGAASSGTITALNNQAANRLTTIGSTTTQLDGEASLTFEDTTSTGLISGKQITGRGFECPAEVSDDWTIAAANNAMFPGPMTIASAKTVTVPAGRTLTIV